MKKSLIRIGVSICNSIPHSVLVKKIKSLLFNALDTEENYLNGTYLIEYFKKLTWYVVFTSTRNISLFF